MNQLSYRVGIISAMEVEQKYLKNNLTHIGCKNINHLMFEFSKLESLTIITTVSKIGQVNAAIATAMMIEKFNPDYVIFLGVAGALDQKLDVGNVIIGKIVLSAEYLNAYLLKIYCSVDNFPPYKYNADPILLKNANYIAENSQGLFKVGIIGSSDYFPCPSYLPSFYEDLMINISDMESVGFHQACQYFKTPGIVIRGVSNNALLGSNVKIKKLDVEKAVENSSYCAIELAKLHLNLSRYS